MKAWALSIYGDTHIRASAELYNFSFCIALASEQLIMTYRKNGADAKESSSSAGIERTLALVPDLKPICFMAPTEVEHIYSKNGCHILHKDERRHAPCR